MKQFLLPVVLICFTILCLVFVHIDNMNKLNKEKIALDKKQDKKMHTKSIQL